MAAFPQLEGALRTRTDPGFPPSCLTAITQQSSTRARSPRSAGCLARLAGFEPATGCLEGSCSVQLSYRRSCLILHATGNPAGHRGQGQGVTGPEIALRSGSVTVHEPWQRAAAPRQRRDRRLGAARWPVAGGLVAGTLLDAIFTDPPRGHPVAAFGRAATALEARTYAATRTRGAVHAAACLLGAAAPAAAADYLTRGRPVLRLAVTAAVGWAVTGAGSLAHEAERLALALDALPEPHPSRDRDEAEALLRER